MKRVIDARGRQCPEPLVMTKREIKRAEIGDQIEVTVDNDTSRCNVEAFLDELGFAHHREQTGDGVYSICFAIGDFSILENQASDNEYCDVVSRPIKRKTDGYVFAIKSATMGMGDDALGELLMRACVNSIPELDTLPRFVVLYNGGVKLALRGTDTAESLARLAQSGVEVVVCGTCVDYFDLKGQLAVGTVSNMYRINTILAESHHVVYP